tara:strand:- start:387 stop:764 length:378 start_codon:yes stop_codon:yes gene_type:complete
MKGEVKARKSGAGFKTIKDWKGSDEFLFLLEDRAEPLVVMDVSLLLRIVRGEVVLAEEKEDSVLALLLPLCPRDSHVSGNVVETVTVIGVRRYKITGCEFCVAQKITELITEEEALKCPTSQATQ